MTSPSEISRQFVHNTTYGILICKSCQYAIQKSALKSHLLRHKIYREEQKQLLSLMGQLNLLEPDEVRSPSLETLPIEHLAVFSGFKCQLSGCGYLCVSTKRMKNHWREAHHEDHCTDSDVVAVSLQTFFRGTKIRYFEVQSSASSDEILHGTGHVSTISPNENSSAASINSEQSEYPDIESPAINLEDLRYFHYYITSVCFTLAKNDVEYWQKEIIAESLRLPWLMSGILAMSVHHTIISSDNTATQRSHWRKMLLYVQEFQRGWRSSQRQNSIVDPQVITSGTRIACLLRSHHLNCKLLDFPSNVSTGQRISLILKAIQGCNNNTTVEIGQVEILSINAEARPLSAPLHPISPPDHLLDAADILHLTQSLPQRLALLLGEPKDIRDVHSVLSAIALLADFISICTSSDRNDWDEMVQWLQAISEHFQALVLDENVAALIVLLCWLKAFEHVECQYWFYYGTSRVIRRLIHEALPRDPGVQNLFKLFE